MENFPHEISFLGHHFSVSEELEAFVAVRRPQEVAAVQLRDRVIADHQKMAADLNQLIPPETKKFVEAVRKIPTLEQAAIDGSEGLLFDFERVTLAEIGRRMIFKYTKFDSVTTTDVMDELSMVATPLYESLSRDFLRDVYQDIGQIEDLHDALLERRELARQNRRTTSYTGYGIGFKGAVNAAVGAAAANLGMGLLGAVVDGAGMVSDERKVRRQEESALDRAKSSLIRMGQEAAKMMESVCYNYITKDMREDLAALNRVHFRDFSEEDRNVLDLKDQNYDEAYAEGDIDEERYAAHIFSVLPDTPYNTYHYAHIIEMACAVGDQETIDRVFALTDFLGLEPFVNDVLKRDKTARVAKLRPMPERTLAQVEEKMAAMAKVYGAQEECKKLRQTAAVFRNIPRLQQRSAACQQRICAGKATLFVQPDHKVGEVHSGDEYQYVKRLTNVAGVSGGKKGTTVALKMDGTVDFGGLYGAKPDPAVWDIAAVSAGAEHYCMLTNRGEVRFGLADRGLQKHGGRMHELNDMTKNWRNMTAISYTETSRNRYAFGVTADGHVLVANYKETGMVEKTKTPEYIKLSEELSSWTDITAVASCNSHVLGLKKDGTVVAAFIGEAEDKKQCDVSGWWGIVAVSTDETHSVGVRLDGTVVATGDNASDQCNVDGWRDIVAVAAGDRRTVGLKSDGTLVTVGYNPDKRGELQNCRVWI